MLFGITRLLGLESITEGFVLISRYRQVQKRSQNVSDGSVALEHLFAPVPAGFEHSPPPQQKRKGWPTLHKFLRLSPSVLD